MSKDDILDRRTIVETLERLVTPGIKLTALADQLGLRKQDYARLRTLLLGMVEDGVARVLPGGAFALAPSGRTSDRKAQLGQRPATAKPEPPYHGTGRAASTARPVVAAPEPDAVLPAPAPRARRATREPPAKRPHLPWKAAKVKAAEAPPPAEPAPRRARRGTRPEPTATAAELPRGHVPGPFAVGRITVHPAGYGFVETDDGRDVFIPAKYRGASLDGDRVQVSTWPGVKGTEGRVEEVLARGRARLTGIVRQAGRAVYLEPDDPRIAADYGKVAIDGTAPGVGIRDGAVVVVEITRYPAPGVPELAGRVLKVLGEPGDPRTEIEKIIAATSIPVEFPDEAAAQAARTAQSLGPADLGDRIDLRSRRFATIDPETARDFDDALCIEDGPHGGPRVWVAVADVSHYVRWDDALDREAQIRGVSVYLPDRVIPMLPHELSSGICSLNPDVDRCAMVVRLDYTDAGDVVDTAYAAAVIRSQGRLDYPGAAAALQGDFRGRREVYRGWAGELGRLDALAQKLRAKRRARGALDLELPEAKVILDADDPRLVRDVVKAKGDPQVKRAYELVEEFMIAANEAVGRYFRGRNTPTVWRVHAPPERERVELLVNLLGAFGIRVDAEAALTPQGMKRVLDQVNEKGPLARSLSFLVLRTLTQAVWDTVPIGHFGLASGDYLHFTSPIRRYPDLLVHRLLKHHLHRDGQPSGGGYRDAPPKVDRLGELAAASSAHERRAMEAEREAVAMYRAYLMRDHVGEEFQGTVSAVTNFGAFTEIEEPYVEGLLRTDTLFAEPYEFDDIHMRLSGRRTGKSIALGDQVMVRIADVSVARRRIDLELVAVARGARPARPAPRERPDRERRAPEPRVGIAGQRRAGREVERAVRDRVEPGAPRRAGAGAKRGGLSLKVSHRGRPGGKPPKR
jgi:ribonuclease R